MTINPNDAWFPANPLIPVGRAVMLDHHRYGHCLLGNPNSRCCGISGPVINGEILCYGLGSDCEVAIDPEFVGIIRDGDILICSSNGYLTLPSSPGSYWQVATARQNSSGGKIKATVNLRPVTVKDGGM